MQSENIHHQQFSGRLHYELQQLETWSDETLVDYIIYTMQRKGMTEYSTALIPGYLGHKYDRPQGWHLLFWPFLGSYRHAYEWNRVFLKDGELLFELEERISKFGYDLFEDTFLEKIFPSPVGETVCERYDPTIITHYHADEFFDMQRQLPKNLKRLDKHHELAWLACSIQFRNPQREAAEAAKRPPLTEAQIEALANAPILKVRSMQDILDEYSGPKKTKFSRILLWVLLISIVVTIPVGIFLHSTQHQAESQFGCSWLEATFIFFGMWFGNSLLIGLFDQHSRVYIKR